MYKVFSFWEYLLSLIFFMAFVFSFYYKTDDPAYKGFLSLKRNQLEKAEKLFKKAVEKNSSDFLSQLNLAFTYDLSKNSDQALQSYFAIPEFAPDELRFYSYFNQAELYGRLGNLDKALENYQKSLDFDYHTTRVKKNIEWLFKNKNQDSQKSSQKDSEKDSQNQKNRTQDDSEDSQKDSEEPFKSQDSSSQEDSDEAEREDLSKEPTGGFQHSDKTGLTKRGEQAILEEIEMQENRIRSQIYKRKKVFGDKTEKDW